MPSDKVTINGDKFLGDALKSTKIEIVFPRTSYWNVRFHAGLLFIKIGARLAGMGVVVNNDDSKSDQA